MVRAPLVPAPPDPFTPLFETLPAGHALYRVHGNRRFGNDFNPGIGGQTRFAFFGDPVVPVLYAADTEEAAISESILHDVPATGGRIGPHQYRGRVISRLVLRRDLRMIRLHGRGLPALRIRARNLTDTERAHYPRTVRWAETAHDHRDEAGSAADGLAWMSRRCNSDRAFVFFGDRATADDFEVDPGYGRLFDASRDLAWLADFCAPLHIDVLV